MTKLSRYYVLSMRNADYPGQSYWLVCDRAHKNPDKKFPTRREARQYCVNLNYGRETTEKEKDNV